MINYGCGITLGPRPSRSSAGGAMEWSAGYGANNGEGGNQGGGPDYTVPLDQSAFGAPGREWVVLSPSEKRPTNRESRRGTMSRHPMTRRAALKTGAGAAVLGVVAPAGLTGGEGPADVTARLTASSAMGAGGSAAQSPSVYEALGLEPIINAAGTITNWGGSLMPPEVTAGLDRSLQAFHRSPHPPGPGGRANRRALGRGGGARHVGSGRRHHARNRRRRDVQGP